MKLNMTEDHAALLRAWAQPERFVGAQSITLDVMRDERPHLESPDRCLVLGRQMETWGLARVTLTGTFGGPYGKPTPAGVQWLEDNPQ